MEEMAKLWIFLRRHNGIYLQANIIYWKGPSGNFEVKYTTRKS